MSDTKNSGEIPKTTEEPVEDTSIIRCAEADTSAEYKSLPDDSSDEEDLAILFTGHLLSNTDDESDLESESSRESSDEFECGEYTTIAGVEALNVRPDKDLETAVGEWRQKLLDEIEDGKSKINIVPTHEQSKENEYTVAEHPIKEENNVEHEKQKELTEVIIDGRNNEVVSDNNEGSEAVSNASSGMISTYYHSEAGSPTLRMPQGLEDTNESDEDKKGTQNLIDLDKEGPYLTDDNASESTIETVLSSSILDETIEDDLDSSNESYNRALLENVKTEEMNALLELLFDDHEVENKKREFTILVEGNIGSGKTTFLQHFSEYDDIEVIKEPVNKWRNVKGSNLLQKMYEDPKRWALVFQTYVQLTMLKQHTDRSNKRVKIMERSLYSAKYCFVENLIKSGNMEQSEYEVLTEWFEFLVKQTDIDLGVDLIIYLQTTPEVAMERVQARNRGEEHLIPMEHVKSLHQLYEDWLINEKFPRPATVVTIDANRNLDEVIKEYLQQENSVFNKIIGNKKGHMKKGEDVLVSIN